MSAVWTHLRRYPKWYGVAAAWLAVIAIAPVVDRPTPRPASRTSSPPVSLVAAPVAPVAVLPAVDTPLPPATPALPGVPVTFPPAPAGAPTPTPPPQPAEPDLFAALLPPLPALPLPAAPKELEPLLQALSPLMTSGCSGIGLAAVVVAVVAPTVEDVPLDRVMPYLVPAYSVCSYFPIPASHTICPLDAQVAAQIPDSITSLYPAPTIMGLGIDEIAGTETAVLQMFGYQIPSLAEQLRTQLDCHVE